MSTKLPNILRQHIPAIKVLCRKHKVKKLWVFGSVLRPEDFRADSDVDFLYEMDDQNITSEERYDCFWGFFDALTSLLDRQIDMIWYKGIKNPYFKADVEKSKRLLYDQSSEKVSV